MHTALSTVFAIGDAIASAIGGAIHDGANPIDTIAADVSRALGDVIQTAAPTMEYIGAYIGAAITRFGNDFVGALGTPEDFWKPVLDAIGIGGTGAIAESLTGTLRELLTKLLPELGLDKAALLRSPTAALLALAAALGTTGDLSSSPSQIAGALGQLSRLAEAGNTSALLLRTIAGAYLLLSTGLEALSSARTELIVQASNESFLPTKLSPAEAVDVFIKGLDHDGLVEESRKAAGIPPEYFKLLVGLRQWLPDPESLTVQQRFGHIDDDTAADYLDRAGVPVERRALLQTLLKYIPTPTDVVSWFTRDAFYPDIVEQFGLDQDYPPDANLWFDRIGVDREVAKNIWRAHWELPSLTLAFEMFQRGSISRDDLHRLMRAQGVEPFWRDKILEVSYVPLTRVDIRRIDKLQHLDIHELTGLYGNIGYSPENAVKLANFTKDLNNAERKAEQAEALAEVKAEVEESFISGTLDEAGARRHLADSGLDPHELDHAIAKARLAEAKRRRQTILAGLKREYVHGRSTDVEVIAALNAEGWSFERASYVVAGWKYDREYTEKDAQRSRSHALTEGQIIAAYEAQLLAKKDADDALKALGVPESDRVLLFKLSDHKLQAQSNKLKATALIREYKARVLSRAETQSRLAALGESPEAIGAQLDAVEAERQQKTVELPLNVIEKLAVDRLVPDDELVTDLRRRGYTEQQIEWLSKVWQRDLSKQLAKEAGQAEQKKVRTDRQLAADKQRKLKAKTAAILRRLKDKKVDEAGAIAALIAAGIAEEEARDLVTAAPK